MWYKRNKPPVTSTHQSPDQTRIRPKVYAKSAAAGCLFQPTPVPIGRSGSRIHSLQEPTYSLAGSRPASSAAKTVKQADTPEPHI